MHLAPLVLPPSIRFATADELRDVDDDDVSVAADLTRIAAANLAAGFVVQASADPRFAVFAQANVQGPDVWRAVVALASALLPEVAALVIGLDDASGMHRCPYTERDVLLSALEPFGPALAADGFLEFGLLFQTPETRQEIFVTATKSFCIWTNHPDRLRAVMHRLQVPEVDALAFFHEYPLTTHAIQHAGIGDFTALIDAVVARCATLPDA